MAIIRKKNTYFHEKMREGCGDFKIKILLNCTNCIIIFQSLLMFMITSGNQPNKIHKRNGGLKLCLIVIKPY